MFIRLPIIFACSAAIQACASHPATPGPAVPARPATTTSTAATTSGTNQVGTSGQAHTLVLEDKTLSQEEVNSLLSQGYKPQKGRGDTVLYCREEAQLGTHFDRKVCMTAEQIKTMMADSRDATEKLQRNLGNPQR